MESRDKVTLPLILILWFLMKVGQLAQRYIFLLFLGGRKLLLNSRLLHIFQNRDFLRLVSSSFLYQLVDRTLDLSLSLYKRSQLLFNFLRDRVRVFSSKVFTRLTQLFAKISRIRITLPKR